MQKVKESSTATEYIRLVSPPSFSFLFPQFSPLSLFFGTVIAKCCLTCPLLPFPSSLRPCGITTFTNSHPPPAASSSSLRARHAQLASSSQPLIPQTTEGSPTVLSGLAPSLPHRLP
ncbi:hypothetical protein BLNAU_23674 [Blattamonas nauphoetae]|uniref:Uncharacterized protein n=1 Tax=Blattamonas nauphoetae TaxID=2049346 RepID=A0ABQ9WPJ2_9EUKA|nr:hypothetical protein BLNAU_23674 [Blattamonas nauphoetae]